MNDVFNPFEKTNTSSVWVLTRGINEYNQDGDYFVAAWQNKPTADQVARAMTDASEPYILPTCRLLAHWMVSGKINGRSDGLEDIWYTLFEYRQL